MTSRLRRAFTIDITDKHITDGEDHSSSHCMIADAISDSVPGAVNVEVTVSQIRFSLGDYRYLFITPRVAQLALIRFDQGIHTEPFVLKMRATEIKERRLKKNGYVSKKPTLKYSRKDKTKEHPVILNGTFPPRDDMLSNYGKTRQFGLKSIPR